jgi:flavin reductase (DIM6/NTAB) family NADH-FMN oxidoreductase RutF
VTAVQDASLDPTLFRGLFRRHAAGVAVITTTDERPVGFTATSLVALSLEPPLLSFNLSRTSSSWAAVDRASYVAVHLLAEHQAEVAGTFARSGADRFAAPTSWSAGPYGVPVLDDVLAWMVCRIETRVVAGDHSVVIGQVIEAAYHPEHRPLVYHDGGFTGLRPAAQ